MNDINIERKEKQINIQNNIIKNISKDYEELKKIYNEQQLVLNNSKIWKLHNLELFLEKVFSILFLHIHNFFHYIKKTIIKLFTHSPIENFVAIKNKILKIRPPKISYNTFTPYFNNLFVNNFTLNNILLNNKAKIAVQINLSNENISKYIVENLEKIPLNFDCFINYDGANQNTIMELFSSINHINKISIKNFPDGTDFNNFYNQIKNVTNNYDYICHLSSKEHSLYENIDSEKWDLFSYKNLLGSEQNITKILNTFSNTNTDLIFSIEYPPVHNINNYKLDDSLKNKNEYNFDNMFWINTNIFNDSSKIKKLLENQNIQSDTFEINYKTVFNNTIRKKSNKSRISLFIHFDKNDQISLSDIEYLKKLKSISSFVYFITNSNLSDKEFKKIENLYDDKLIRANFGYDFGAWKDAITILGVDFIRKFDELLLCNNSCFAPIFDLETIFSEMEEKKYDFWGMTIHDELKDETIAVLPEHIQSYFICFTKNVTNSQLFVDYWSESTYTNSLMETVLNSEVKLTEYFAKQFSYGCVCDSIRHHLNNFYGLNYTIAEPEAVLLSGSPLIKKKAIHDSRADSISDLFRIVNCIDNFNFFEL